MGILGRLKRMGGRAKRMGGRVKRLVSRQHQIQPVIQPVVDQPQQPLPDLDKYTKDALTLAGVFDFSYADIAEVQQHPDRVSSQAPYTLNWYLPSFENAFYGGVMTILRTANHLLQSGGMHQRFLICGNTTASEMQALIVKAFPRLEVSEVLILNSPETIAAIPPSDFSIATLWSTAYLLLKIKNTGLKFYFIQDFEPLFYPAGSTYAQAEATYRFGFYGIANTISLKKIYESDYGGKAVHFTPCVDLSVFYPEAGQRESAPKQVFFYGRPGHPRNGFELAIEAMKRLKQRYGSTIRICSAGANWNPEDYGVGDVIENLGLLDYQKTGELYRSCHVGLSMMMTRHPSYLPLEMMACGMLVVSNFNPSNSWLLRDRENCLLTHPSATCIAETIAEAIDQYDDLAHIRKTAIEHIQTHHADWSTELETLHQALLGFEPKTSGMLMQSSESVFGAMVFYVKNGYRYYVPSSDWMLAHGFKWPNDVQFVSEDVLLALRPARATPRSWSLDDWLNPPRHSSFVMREVAASRLSGTGIEFGAGASPFPIPLDCHVSYADRRHKSELEEDLYPGQTLHSLIEPDLISDLDTLVGIDDASLDFIVACHVIEHTKSPISALEKAYQKLRPGGQLILVVPDKERTFDRNRDITPLQHLIADYQEPSRERDKQHYFDFYEQAFPTAPDRLTEVVETKFQQGHDIHYHTFTYDSFTEVVNYVCKHVAPWSSVWSQPTLSNPEHDIEFYFVLTK
ncbi:MAG: glycosyltransferase [Tildeniella nuda ZEHNDER 1965/U140]|jgi:SAM-dependent methyltransferase|nr:glycosyltransferase [Tildeniella nuda ZEHNDER 1965/U140]